MALNLDIHSSSSSPSSSLAVDDLEIITALRYDRTLSQSSANESCDPTDSLACQLYMLPRHNYRMLAAAREFGWPSTSQKPIHGLEGEIRTHLESTYGPGTPPDPLKIRAALSSTGNLNITSTHVAAVLPVSLFPKSLSDVISFDSPATFHIFIATIPITPSPFTRHKTTSRAQYDNARVMSLTKQSEGESASLLIELLLYNGMGEIMEGSITTPYFSRDGQWITPSAECGGNLGTTRQYALDNGLCTEGIVERSSVLVGEKIVLSNGVKGFGWGIIGQT